MPLGIPSGQYLGFLACFNDIAVSGFIGKNELRAILERAGRDPTDVEIQKILDDVSVDGRGINFQAFIDYTKTFNRLRNVEQEYREALRSYDPNSEGRLNQDDVAYVFERLRVKADVPALFQIADTDRSGTIEYNEFVDLMNKSL